LTNQAANHPLICPAIRSRIHRRLRHGYRKLAVRAQYWDGPRRLQRRRRAL